MLGWLGQPTLPPCDALTCCAALLLLPLRAPQLQAQLGEGHINLVRVEAAVLTPSHLGLVMEYVPGGTLTRFVTRRASSLAERQGLFLDEDEARYFFKVGSRGGGQSRGGTPGAGGTPDCVGVCVCARACVIVTA